MQIWYSECSWSVQLTSPYEVKVQQTPGAFNITWKSGYEKHSYLAEYLDYELLLQSFQSSESKVRSHVITIYALLTCFALIRSNNNHLFDCFSQIPILFIANTRRRLYQFQDPLLNHMINIALKWGLYLPCELGMLELGVKGVSGHAGKTIKCKKVKCHLFFLSFWL